MFTTGTKLLVGSAVAAGVFALIYGVTQGGALGTIGLLSAAAGLALLAGINTWFRDSNVSAMDHDAFAGSAAAQATARPSAWPLLAALGATTLALGLATFRAIFVIGLVVLILAAIEWLVQAWSERASADTAYNAHARNFLVDPIELPVLGAAGAAIVVYSFSRVMLGLPSKSATVVAFSIVATLVLLIGTLVGVARAASKVALGGTFGIAAVALIAGGAIYGLNGERETHPHHTIGDVAEENECGPEETEADERASQTVAAKSNAAAEIIFDGDRLKADLPGYDGGSAGLTLLRSNPNHLLFHNDSDEEARLVIEMHPRLDDDDRPLGPERVCTTLVEPGGTQFVTVKFAQPSAAVEDGYLFTVPGTDATLPVVVP
jgi:hypothetical protein